MSSKNNGLSVSPGTVLSLFCLLLYSAGFVRIELKFNDHDQRLTAVEEVISQMKHGMADTSNKSKVLFKSKTSSSSAIRLSIVSVHYITKYVETLLRSLVNMRFISFHKQTKLIQ